MENVTFWHSKIRLRRKHKVNPRWMRYFNYFNYADDFFQLRWWLLLGERLRYSVTRSTLSRVFIESCHMVHKFWLPNFAIELGGRLVHQETQTTNGEVGTNQCSYSMKEGVQVFGVTFQSNGLYTAHIQNVVAKCHKRLNMMSFLKGTSWGASKSPFLTIDRCLVRSVLEYGMDAYFFSAKSLVDPLVKIQNETLRLCTDRHAEHTNTVPPARMQRDASGF